MFDSIEFCIWAFGKDYKDLKDPVGHISLMNRWNQLHGDLLMLKPDGLIEHDSREMMKLWEQSKLGESRDYW